MRLDLNTATAQDLSHRITSVDAESIIAHRTSNGPFESLDDPFFNSLSTVSLDQLRAMVEDGELRIGTPSPAYSFKIELRPQPPLTGAPSFHVDVIYWTQRGEEKTQSTTFSLDEVLPLEGADVDFGHPIRVRIDAPSGGGTLLDRVFQTGSATDAFYESIDIDTRPWEPQRSTGFKIDLSPKPLLTGGPALHVELVYRTPLGQELTLSPVFPLDEVLTLERYDVNLHYPITVRVQDAAGEQIQKSEFSTRDIIRGRDGNVFRATIDVDTRAVKPPRPASFKIQLSPNPPLTDGPVFQVHLAYRTHLGEESVVSSHFPLNEVLLLERDDVSFSYSITVRVETVEGGVLQTRVFKHPELRKGHDSENVFHATIGVATNAVVAPSDHRLVRTGQYLVATNPAQRFDGYRLVVAPVRTEDEKEAAEILLGRDLATAAVELDRSDRQVAARLSSFALQEAEFEFEGSFSLDRPFEGDPAQYAGWVWLLAGPSLFFGFQSEEKIAPPKHGVTIVLPVFEVAVGQGKDVPYDVSEKALLGRPDIFADDPGTTCKPFDNPGRILGERSFSTILRVTQAEISPERSRSSNSPDETVEFPRPAVTMDDPLDWEGDTTQYQARTVARGHIVEFRVRWRSNGYSLGDVAHSLTLAPRQKRRIVKVDYSRRERAVRQEETLSRDEVDQATLHDRDYADVVEAGLTEWSQGKSKASTTGAAAGLGFFGKGFTIGGGASHGRSSASSESSGGRDVSASEQQSLRDSIRQYGDSLRSLESTVVTEAEQEESVEGVSEVVRNINYCHALSIIYYEILRHLRVDTEVGGVRECLFVPLAIKDFDDKRIAKHRKVLNRYVRNRAQRTALNYLREIQDNFKKAGSVPEGQRKTQKLTYLNGSIFLDLSITRPLEGEYAKEVKEGTRTEFSETDRFRKIVAAFGPFAGLLPISAPELAHTLFEVTESQRDDYFQRKIAPHMARVFADQLQLGIQKNGRFIALDADFTMVGHYRYGRNVRIDFTVPVEEGLTRADTGKLIVRAPEDRPLPVRSIANVTHGRISFATDHYDRHNVYSDRSVRDITDPITGQPDDDGATLLFPFSNYENANFRLELMNAYSDLKHELSENLYYYHKAIWWSMDRDALYTLLDGFSVSDEDGRSIASLVERSPIGILGNTLVFRVSAGTVLDPILNSPEKLLANYRADVPKADPMRISLPTSGLYARAHMDDCNAAEEHQGSHDWVLAEDEPDFADLPASLLHSRRSEPADLTPTPFAGTLINLQNAPPAPDPAGFGGLISAVSSADAFRDMAGLTGTQQSASNSMQTAANLATTFGQMAHAQAMAENKSNADAAKNLQAMAAVTERAVERGQLTKKEGSEVIKNFFDKTTKPSSKVKSVGEDLKDVAEGFEKVVHKIGQEGSVKVVKSPEGVAAVEIHTGTEVLHPEPDDVLFSAATYVVKDKEARLRDPNEDYKAISVGGVYRIIDKGTRVRLASVIQHSELGWVVEMLTESTTQVQSLGWTLLSNLRLFTPLPSADELTTRIVRCIGIKEYNQGGGDNYVLRESDLDTVAGLSASMATIEQATMSYAVDHIRRNQTLFSRATPPLELKDLNDANSRCIAVAALLKAVDTASRAGTTPDKYIKGNSAAITATGLSEADVQTMFKAVTLKGTVDAARARIDKQVIREKRTGDKAADKAADKKYEAAWEAKLNEEIVGFPDAARMGLGRGSVKAYIRRASTWGEHKAAWARKAVNTMPGDVGARIEHVAVSENGEALALLVNRVRVDVELAKDPVPSEEDIVKAVGQKNNPGSAGYDESVWRIYERLY